LIFKDVLGESSKRKRKAESKKRKVLRSSKEVGGDRFSEKADDDRAKDSNGRGPKHLKLALQRELATRRPGSAGKLVARPQETTTLQSYWNGDLPTQVPGDLDRDVPGFNSASGGRETLTKYPSDGLERRGLNTRGGVKKEKRLQSPMEETGRRVKRGSGKKRSPPGFVHEG